MATWTKKACHLLKQKAPITKMGDRIDGQNHIKTAARQRQGAIEISNMNLQHGANARAAATHGRKNVRQGAAGAAAQIGE
jgi:hypothetical protein